MEAQDAVQECTGVELDHEDLVAETRKMKASFNVLFTKVRRSLQMQKVSVKDFVFFLEGVPAYPGGAESLFSAVIPELYKKEDLVDVFSAVRGYCSWFNYSLIGDIVSAYCVDDASVKQCLQDFCNDLGKYVKHRICRCQWSLTNGFGIGRKQDFVHITVKIDQMWESIRVEQLVEVIGCLTDILKVHRRTLYLRSVQNGCVELSFLVPEVVHCVIISLSVTQKAALLDVGVLQLHCHDYVLSEFSSVSTQTLLCMHGQ